MTDPRDSVEFVSGSGGSANARERRDVEGGEAGTRPFLGLWFRCANKYVRAYKTRDGRAYEGRCPKCSQTVRFAVGPGGTNERFFEVNC